MYQPKQFDVIQIADKNFVINHCSKLLRLEEMNAVQVCNVHTSEKKLSKNNHICI